MMYIEKERQYEMEQEILLFGDQPNENPGEPTLAEVQEEYETALELSETAGTEAARRSWRNEAAILKDTLDAMMEELANA